MAKMIEIQLDPDEQTLKQFGFIALVGMGAIAALAWFVWLVFAGGWLGEARPVVAATIASVGVLAALISLLYPRANKPLFIGLSLAAFPIGWVLSHVIMATLFFLIITPIGLVMRGLGRDPLDNRFADGAESYWRQSRASRSSSSYFKQF